MPAVTHQEQLTAQQVSAMIEEIEKLPVEREVVHCGATFMASPFAFYGVCPICGSKIKLRSFGAVTETQDVFDAVFAWMNKPGALHMAEERRKELLEDAE
jgi:hypothetical protein